MRNFRVGLLAVATLLAACAGTGANATGDGSAADTAARAPTRDDPAAAEELFAAATNALAVDLWEQLRQQEGNLAVAPASIEIALGMTLGGARGATAEQMAKVLHAGDDTSAFHAAAGRALASWNDSDADDYELTLANRLFGEGDYRWQQPFLEFAQATYRAPLETVDFRNEPEPARLHINSWVEDETNERIEDLLPEASIDADTRMVLVNAVYFLADWTHAFDPNQTRDRPFFAAAGERQVPTMRQQARFPYGEADGVQLLEMPYQGGDLSMLIALPTDRDGLAAVERDLSPARLEAWTELLEPRMVDVSLPRYRVDPAQSLALGEALKAMGMTDAFHPHRADFSAMADPAENGGRPLFVDAVFHKAFVAVDEEGTEAAAATGVVMTRESAAMPPPDMIDFVADRPFLFFIRDQKTGAILFMGRVADPAA